MPQPDPEEKIDATFRNGSLTAAGIILGFSLNFIGRWVSLIRPAAEALGDEPRGPDYLEQLEFATVTNSLRNLMTFPCVKILVERGKLQLHGAHFGIATGQLRVRDPETGEFRLAEPGRAAAQTRLIRCQDEAGSGG